MKKQTWRSSEQKRDANPLQGRRVALWKAGVLVVSALLSTNASVVGDGSESDSVSVFVAEMDARGILEVARSGSMGDRDREETIRVVYDLLGRYSRDGASDLRFDLYDFQTFDRKDFSQIRYGDIVTLTGGNVIDITRQSHRDENSGIKTVRYIPVWSKHPGPAALEAEGLRLDSASVEEVLGATSKDAALASIGALTSYAVEVSLRGESRTYQAAFFWRTPAPGSEISFYAVDLVTQGVPEVALDPDLTVKQLDAQQPARRSLGRFAGASSMMCDDYSVSDYYAPRKQTGSQGHYGTGQHYAQPLFENDCSCDRNCTSECAASVSPIWCNDRGIPTDGLCHKMSQGQDDSHSRIYGATSRGASCSSGFGCAVKSCVFGCLCAGISVDVKASSSGASISFGSGALWTKKFSDRTTCAPCDSIQSPPPSPPPSDPTPIVIDLDRRGFRLTSVSRGVDFDIDADGELERVSWTDRRSEDAFLARDRNGNGVIDDGSELFGNFSPQDAAEDSEKNGFRALAMFDKKRAGGNEDGAISARDAGSGLLILWRDSNQDGISQREEMVPLLDLVSRIRLDHRVSRRRDRYGNQFLLMSWARLVTGKKTPAVDVTLATSDR